MGEGGPERGREEEEGGGGDDRLKFEIKFEFKFDFERDWEEEEEENFALGIIWDGTGRGGGKVKEEWE